MIFEFLFPILGWLVAFGICYIVYNNIFYKHEKNEVHSEGQVFYTVLTSFFWITVYMCLSSIWSILYALIDLKYPDIVNAVSDYGQNGFQGAGVVYDAFAFPLATTLVSALTACILAFFLISKFKDNKNLRPQKLYFFLRTLVFIGGAVLAFSGFVYVVYSWLYGNLPIAIFFKGLVAFIIVGISALYFHLVADGKNRNESLIGKIFAAFLVLATVATLYISFQVIGTPAEARKYRLDAITLENLRQVKSEIDNLDQNFGKKIQSLSEINTDYVKSSLRKTPMTYSTTDKDYTLCANFNADVPLTINLENRDTTWDYKIGESCFTFSHLPTYLNVNANINNIPKPIYNQ